ncbi:LemA family protein [Flavobacterium aquatile]|uniref:LemA family protein n=1 Tax=Flavobacterium aquatile LMG 4008 = ATCC 11947 TaxID=1453498 RepID=A0A095SXN1_9FLAO|nr:LemA family protein [Flavobacterium aquatile]KGD69461.1 LemA family protein [Flavobacterium aquatile LMG 4008 = ATCC 11947]OXA66083.1 LemA family protein [Flavobacterium aquatile] [Flavobacterium aquatile LMG 4008 = ATCC 11947]GEC77566.1 LemA family protein [Flavobacterium aquatile]
MRKFLPWIILVVVILIGYSWFKGINNTAVTLNQNIEEAWGNVETSYQRRNDLIVNLVKTVQGAAEYEKGTLEAVVQARASATKTVVDPTNITPEQLEKFSQNQSALSRLLVTVENYPSLQANQGFLKLQDELASTENQILTARTRFNEAVKPYNTHIKTFPNSLFAGIFGFKEKPYFKSVEGADKAPEVEFNFDKKEAK